MTIGGWEWNLGDQLGTKALTIYINKSGRWGRSSKGDWEGTTDTIGRKVRKIGVQGAKWGNRTKEAGVFNWSVLNMMNDY